MKPYYIHEVFYSDTTLGAFEGSGWKGTKYFREKFPQRAVYKDPKLSDKEMSAVYNEERHAYWVVIEPGNKAVFMLLETMNLDNLHPHPENTFFYEITTVAPDS
jgi:hypothetical protein